MIYSTRHRGRVVDEVRAQPGGALRKPPLVVLVNEYSASASELVAGALQDHERATVVGAKTFGKGSVQTILDLPGGDGLRMTTMRYYTPDGQAIQARGITPDVAVAASRKPDKSFGVIRESDLEKSSSRGGAAGLSTEDQIEEAQGGGRRVRDPLGRGSQAAEGPVRRRGPGAVDRIPDRARRHGPQKETKVDV